MTKTPEKPPAATPKPDAGISEGGAAETAPTPNAPTPNTPAAKDAEKPPKEIGGREGLDPTRYGDWEKAGRCVDF